MPKKVSVFKKAIEKLSSFDYRDLYPGLLLMAQVEDPEKQSECVKAALNSKSGDYVRLFGMYMLAISGQMKEKLELDLSTIDLPPDSRFLEFMPNLETLNLGYWKGLEDLSSLLELQNLVSLQIGGDSIKNIKSIAKLTRLEELHLSNCDILSNISPLESLQNLRTLSMYSCYGVKRLDSLAALSKLRELTFYSCPGVKRLDSLQSLANLRTLEITSCDELINIEPLEKLAQLEVLRISFCENISDIEPICHLTNLTELDISSCEKIVRFDSLSTLGRLLKLDLSNTKLRDLNFLKSMKNLTELTIFNTCPADLAPLENLPEMQSLMLSSYYWDDNSNFNFLSVMPNLKKFEFESKKEKKPQISSIPHSASLESFSFNGSRSEFDYGLVNNFPNLKSLTLRSTRLVGSPASLLTNEVLEEIIINSCGDLGEFAELARHPALKVVEFIHCAPSDVEKIKALDSKIEFRF